MFKSLDQLSDEEIVRMVQSGGLESFGILVKRYQEKMLRYGRKFLFNNNDIEDLVQEVFIKAYTNIQSFDASRKFSALIYRSAKSRIYENRLLSHIQYIHRGRLSHGRTN